MVGDMEHCTTFEMLGNWSLNDYFKKEAINLTVEFFVEELGIDINKIYASVFKGEGEIPMDDESVEIWKEIFLKYKIAAKVGKNERIMALGKEDNWWELAAGGPCGPDSEIFYKTDAGKLIEIGNNVFMQYLLEDGEYKPLGIHNVDFGGGLDRLAMISQGVASVFEVDIYKPILEKVQSLNKIHDVKSERIVVDHIKAATWIIMDGVEPSRNERGYVLRKLIRRAINNAKSLGIEKPFTRQVGGIAIEQFSPVWPKLAEDKERILNVLEQEEIKCNKANKIARDPKNFDSPTGPTSAYLERGLYIEGKSPTGFAGFDYYQRTGLDIEMIIKELKKRNIKIDEEKYLEEFDTAMKQHQEQSRTASKGMFKGGLADTSEMSTKYHTTTHLLLEALRRVLGNQIVQKGANITPERLRFDYNSEKKLTPEQVKKVEDIVNNQIKEDLPVTFEILPKKEAIKKVETAVFTEKYGDEVKVYYIGDKKSPFSIEICGGPHVENTGGLGTFRITKQKNVGAGIKRIKGVLE